MSTPSMNLANAARAVGWDDALEVSPSTGNHRLVPPHNDVLGVIELLGGVESASERLAVEPIEVHHWIDDHYVPTRYAKAIKKLTGWSVWSQQTPPFNTDSSALVAENSR